MADTTIPVIRKVIRPIIKMQSQPLNYIYQEFLKDIKSTNLNPDYQRDFSWSIEKQNLFIDTIMKGYIVPPIIILKRTRTTEDDYKYECIDGQHRLKVIKYFIESKPIPKNNENHIIFWENDNEQKTYYNFNVVNLKGKKGIQLSLKEKDIFNSFEIGLIMIDDIGNTSETKLFLKDVFLRLQKGESVKTLDKLRNHSHKSIPAFNEKNLFKPDTYDIKLNITPYSKLTEIIQTHLKGIKFKSNFIPYLIIKACLILQSKSLYIGSYMHLNLTKALQNTHKHPTLHNLTYEFAKTNLQIVETICNELYEKFNNKKIIIHEHLFYILVYIYFENKDKFKFYISNIKKITDKYNLKSTYDTSFVKGNSINKVPKQTLCGKDYTKLIEYIDIDVHCSIKSNVPIIIYKNNTSQMIETTDVNTQENTESSDDNEDNIENNIDIIQFDNIS